MIEDINIENIDNQSTNDLIFTKKSDNIISLKKRNQFEILQIPDTTKIKQNLYVNDATRIYENLKQIWINDFEQIDDIDNSEINRQSLLLQIIQKNLKISCDDSHEDINNKSIKGLEEILSIKNYFENGGKIKDDEAIDYTDIKNNINRIYECIEYAKKTLKSLNFIEITQDCNYDNGANNDTDIDKVKIIDIFSHDNQLKNDKDEEITKLYFYFLTELYLTNSRRYLNGHDNDNAFVYNPVIVNYKNQKYNTFSYFNKYTVKEFLYEKSSREHNLNVFSIINRRYGGNPKPIQTFLSNTIDSYFLDIIKDRNVFSFKNGVYMNRFYDTKNNIFIDKFFPYNTHYDEIKKVLGNKVSCNFFNLDFEFISDTDNKEFDWYHDIKTPNLQKIMDIQWKDEEEYEDICRITYMLIGRLLYDLGDLDEWQIIPFLKGLAGTGKGTLLKIIQYIYDDNDVGIMANNIERLFGIGPLIDKFTIIAPEIEKDFKLDQAVAQSMISSESISYAVKNKSSGTIQKWKIPFALASNVFPDWSDNSGSLQRRFIMLQFNKIVPKEKIDPELSNKLKKEIPLILQKCSKAYLYYHHKYQYNNVWTFMPKFIEKGKLEIAKNSNNFYLFLSDGDIKFDKDYYIPFDVFKKHYIQYCTDNKLNISNLSPEIYLKAFDLFGKINNSDISIFDTTQNKYNATLEYVNGDIETNIKLNKTFIKGVSITPYLEESQSVKFIKDITKYN